MDSKRGMVAVYQEVGRQGNGQEVSPKQDEQTTDIGPIVNTNFLNAYMSVNTDNLISRVLTTRKKVICMGKIILPTSQSMHILKQHAKDMVHLLAGSCVC